MINFDRYLFDRRLKDLQDKVLSINYRKPEDQNQYQPQFLQSQYYPSPQQTNMPQQIQYIPVQQNESDSDDDEPISQPTRSYPISNRQINVPQKDLRLDLIEQQRLQHKAMLENMLTQENNQIQYLAAYMDQQNQIIKAISDNFKNEAKQKQKAQEKLEEERFKDLQIKKIEKKLQKKQDAQIKIMKHEILDSLDSYYPPNIPPPQYQNEFFSNIPNQNYLPPYNFDGVMTQSRLAKTGQQLMNYF